MTITQDLFIDRRETHDFRSVAGLLGSVSTYFAHEGFSGIDERTKDALLALQWEELSSHTCE